MSNLAGRTFAVTGGAGFIGSHVVDQLVQSGARAVVIDDLSVGRRENLAAANASGRARLEALDVCDFDAVRRALKDCDTVLHLAVQCLRLSLADPMRVHEVNATGTLQVLRAAREVGATRFVYVSSSEVYGSAIDEVSPIRESDPLLPTTPYGASKAAGELYTESFQRAYGLATTVVRPFNSFGPRSHAQGAYGEVIPRFVARVLGGTAPLIFGDGKQTRDFTFVEDTARGIIAAATSERSIGRAVNIARGREITITEVATAVARVLGRPELTAIYEPARPADVRRHLADTSLAQELLGYDAAVDFDEGLRRYVGWVREQGVEIGAEAAGRRNW